MRPLIQEDNSSVSPEQLCEQLLGRRGLVLLRSALFDETRARYSFVTAEPFLTFRSVGSRCELISAAAGSQIQYGNPWRLLEALMSRYELLDEVDLPFPLGGCFGYWGYDLKNFVEPRLTRRAVNDLELPDCQVGFYHSLVVFDHCLGKIWIVSTGLAEDGSRSREAAARQSDEWARVLRRAGGSPADDRRQPSQAMRDQPVIGSNLSQADFLSLVAQAQRYIGAGDIYQVNLSQRLNAALSLSPWHCFRRLADVSPAPFAAFLDYADYQIISSSPELFLRLSGPHIQTRPIKGTRPRSADPNRDAQLSYELQTSAKEMAELVMITDLLRNDLGKICSYGSVHVPELARLERYPHVQHLVSTVEGQMRPEMTHFSAFASCFPGGSITGAPKIRAMEIIDELEPVTRGAYTGSIGYLGFNRESQLNIAIRTAVCSQNHLYFHTGAGIVADSKASEEYEETMAKAAGFIAALWRVNNPVESWPYT
jgi:para-aminobenzoate synthetase component 1